MAFDPNTQTFDTVTDLYLRGGSANTRVNTLGYLEKGDGGGASYYWDSLSSATDNGGTIIKPTPVSGAGRWTLIHNGVINAAQFGAVIGETSEQAAIVAALAVSGLKKLVFNNLGTKQYSITTVITVPAGVVISFENDNYLDFSGAGQLSGGIIECDHRKRCFAGTLNVVNLENSEVSAMWFGGKADAVFQGPTPTDNLAPANAALDCMKVAGKIHFPGSDQTASYYYSFSATWIIDKKVEIYGDGDGRTTFLFPGTAGSGLHLLFSAGGATIRDLMVRGTYSNASPNINSSTAHGIFVQAPQNVIERTTVWGFDGDGYRVQGNVGSGTNANKNRLVNCNALKNGRAGFYADSGDANACLFEHPNASSNGRYGIWDSSFLGNTWINAHVASNAHAHNFNKSVIWYRPGVSHGGNRYRVKINSSHINKEPGVAVDWATYWDLIGAGGTDGTYHTWSSLTTYSSDVYWALQDNVDIEPTVTANWEDYWVFHDNIAPSFYNEWTHTTQFLSGGGYYVDNGNARALFLGCYKEGDQPLFQNAGLSIIIGGFASSSGSFAGSIGRSAEGISTTSLQLWFNESEEPSLWIKKPTVENGSFFEMLDESTDGAVTFTGASPSGFMPVLTFKPEGGSSFNSNFIIGRSTDAGTNAVIKFAARNITGTAGLSTQPLFSFDNYTTPVLTIAANGNLTSTSLTGTGTRIPLVSSTGVISALANDTDGKVLTLVSGAPAWATVGGGGGSGTVGSGTQYRLAYYATTGTTVDQAAAITASRAIISDTNGVPTHSTTTSTEIGYVSGVTSAIQTQLNTKATNPMTTAVDIIVGGASGIPTRLAAGTANQLLAINNAANGLEYKTISTSTTAVSNDIGVTLSGANAIVINIPTANGTVRGALSNTDWQTFNSKIGGTLASGRVPYASGTGTITDTTNLQWNNTNQNLIVNGGSTGSPGFTVSKDASGTATYFSMTPNTGTGLMTFTDGASSGFLPTITMQADGTSQNQCFIIGRTNDSGSGGVITFSARNLAGSGGLSTKDLFTFQNFTTEVFKIAGNNNSSFPTGTLTLGVAGTAKGVLKLTGETSGTFTFQAPAVVTSWTFTAPSAAPGTNGFVLAGNTDGTTSWVAQSGGGLSDGDKGDITVSASGATWTIDNDVVTYAKMQNIATSSFVGRVTASTGDPETLTGTQATTLLDVFTSSLKGLAPASGGGTTNYLRADGTWAAPSGGGGGLTRSDTSVASDTTPDPVGSSDFNYYTLTALAGGATFSAPSGTLANGNRLVIRIKDNGTARSLAWNAVYRGNSDIGLPSTTIISETMYVEFIHNSTDNKWDLVGVVNGVI